MKTGKDIVALAAEIKRRADAKKDYVVQTPKIRMVSTNDVPGNTVAPHYAIGTEGQLLAEGVTQHTHRQIGSHLGIPAGFYDRLKDKHPGILLANVNGLMAKEPEDGKRLVRTLDGNARAFLSDRYRPLENEELAEAVLPVLNDLQVEFVSMEITERRLYIKVVDKSIKKDIPKGRALGDGSHTIFDTVSPAMSIMNSEIGAGSLKLEVGTLTAMCTNLAWMSDRGFKKYHIGGKLEMEGEDGHQFLRDETKRLKDAAVWATIRDLVAGAFNAERFNAMVDETIIPTTERKITGQVVEVVKVASKAFGLTDTEGSSVLDHLLKGHDLSQYGLHSAITRTAEDIVDYDRATDIERIGGNVLALPATDWKRIAEAA